METSNNLLVLLLQLKNERPKNFQKVQKKKIVVEKSESKSGTMADIDNYQDSSVQASDDVESTVAESDSVNEESSRESGDEVDDPLSLPIYARDVFGKSYGLATWMDEIWLFQAKNFCKSKNGCLPWF